MLLRHSLVGSDIAEHPVLLLIVSSHAATTNTSRCGLGVIFQQPASAFSGCPRGHRDFTEAKCHRHLCAYRRLGCSPSNPSVSRTDQPPPEKISGDGRALHP